MSVDTSVAMVDSATTSTSNCYDYSIGDDQHCERGCGHTLVCLASRRGRRRHHTKPPPCVTTIAVAVAATAV